MLGHVDVGDLHGRDPVESEGPQGRRGVAPRLQIAVALQHEHPERVDLTPRRLGPGGDVVGQVESLAPLQPVVDPGLDLVPGRRHRDRGLVAVGRIAGDRVEFGQRGVDRRPLAGSGDLRSVRSASISASASSADSRNGRVR